jgi:hypothetical protein
MIVIDDEVAGVALPEPEDSERKQFWNEFLTGLQLDDPEQRKANATNQGAIYFPLPATTWLTVYRNVAKREVGVFLSYTRGSDGERVNERLLSDWENIKAELSGSVEVWIDSAGEKSAGSPRTLIIDKLRTGNLSDLAAKEHAFEWLRRRTNDFVNALRPRVRAAAADLNLEMR